MKKIYRKITFIIGLVGVLLSFNNVVFAGNLSIDQICTKNSDCASSCCMPDVNQNEDLKYYYYGILNNYSDVSVPSLTNINNICWERDTCDSGYNIVDLEMASCGCLGGSVLSSQPSSSNTSLCFIGSPEEIKFSASTNKYIWKCRSHGVAVNCAATKGVVDSIITASCFNYSNTISYKPSSSLLCTCGEPNDPILVDNQWMWTCSSSSSDVECSAESSIAAPKKVSEVDPMANVSTSTTTNSTTSSSTIKTNYPDVKIPDSKIVDNYKLLEKISQKCSILYDKECGVIDKNLLSAITSELTIQEAIDQNKMNPSWKIAKPGDTFETGFTLENIKKLKTYRIFPFGFELAARCIAGEIPCANGVKYNGIGGNPSKLPDTTLQEVINGYYECGSPNDDNDDGKFCHLVNPNWVLKAPDYKCESGSVYSPILTATENATDSNIRYEYCPDISSCISENDNGSCNTFGYCMREKNIWRFGVSADKCNSENISCTKYSYTLNQVQKEIGLIKDSVDSSSCDSTNSGCRKYSTVKTGENSKDWSDLDNNKIYLNNSLESCDFAEEGCTAFIRRDVANLIKNSSFEDYIIPDIINPVIKVANLFVANNYDTYGKVYVDNTNVLNGSWSLYISRSSESTYGYTNYMLDSNNLIDVEPNKTYTLSYYISGLLDDNNYFSNGYGYGAYVDIKEYDKNKGRITSTPLNYADTLAFRYVNDEVGSVWTRKKIIFKTSTSTEYLNIIPIVSNLSGFAYFDAIQLQEGSQLTDYKIYEDSPLNYLKKAPDYMNCYNSTTTDDSPSCARFAKGCDIRNAGCRKYTKADDTEFWLPGKPTESNVCYSECKNYELYKEQGPSYNKEGGASFKSLISSTGKSCDAFNAGCSEYINLSNSNKEYFSSIKGCVKESSLSSIEKEYADYFTYTGSETSGFKLNVYRLLRSKFCQAGDFIGDKCFNNSDCGSGGLCTYDNSKFAPAEKNPNKILCNETEYSKVTRDPGCREFHGPKNKEQADNPTEQSEYILYYAKIDDVVPVSEENCQYYEISLEDSYLEKSLCDDISYLPVNMNPEDLFVGRYKYDTGLTCIEGDSLKIGVTCDNAADCGVGGVCGKKNLSCNVGIYIPESEICSSSENGCREYKGTASISETLFYDNIERDNLYDWVSGNNNPITLSRESLFVNESSVKILNSTNNGENNIKKDISSYVDTGNNINLYKVSLYVKNNSTGGTNSKISVKIGNKTIQKDINNNWRFVTFAVYSSTDFATDKNIYIINNSDTYDIYVDYIKFEQSQSEYLIRNTWNTPVSCDNDYDNPQGTCTAEYETLGYCTRAPEKICLTGNLGATCVLDDTNPLYPFATYGYGNVCGSINDVCDYPNKYCSSSSDYSGNRCEADSDCFISEESIVSGSCTTSISGYRLSLGKMIGCNEYVDPYKNTGFYVFNDLNLCSIDKMGCEAVYDTYNSYSYKKEEYNKIKNITNLYAYYEFDKQSDLGTDSSGNGNHFSSIASNLYSTDAIYDGSLSSSSSSFNVVNDNFDLSGDVTNGKNKLLTISAWVKPSTGGVIAKRNNSFALELVSYGDQLALKCSGYGYGYGNIPAIQSGGVVEKDKWNHVACVYDGNKFKLYVDGSLEKMGDIIGAAINYSSTDNLFIAQGYSGKIDDLRIYKKVLASQDVLDLYEDYKDNVIIPEDKLIYMIVDTNYSCDSKYKGCSAIGRREDRYDNYGDYSTVYYLVNPDKFKSYASNVGVNSGSLCEKKAEGCYSFKNGTSNENFKFPKNICVYRENVDVGYGNNEFRTGWFKYDYETEKVTDVGCYYTEVRSLLGTDLAAKYSPNSYNLYKSNECEYKNDVVVRRDMISYGASYVAHPKIAYYIYDGDQKTNTKCSDEDLKNPNKNCKPYGYKEDVGIIDEFNNNTYQFNICDRTSGEKYGMSCSTNADCSGGKCVPPYIVSGWFKTGTTNGCSDDGDNSVESGDYKRIYNQSVGICSEYGCIEFIEPTENICSGGTTYGYPCESPQDCGTSGSYSCVPDENTGNKYCVSTSGDGVENVNKNGSSCKLNSQCGFGGECIGNNNYTYINNSKIDKTSCSTVSRQEGCVLFNDTSNSTLSYSSEYTYLKANQNSGRGVAPQVGDNSGGARQKDSNVIIKVKRDRGCAEWLSFDNGKFVSGVVDTGGTNTCIELASDGSCKIFGSGWIGSDGGNGYGLNSAYYKGQMRGEWSNNDFSGFAIYGKASIDNAWWNSPFVDGYGRNIGPNSTATSGTIAGVIDNLICKKYPEKDSPFNFTDKYETEYVPGYGYGNYCSGEIYATFESCTSSCYFGSGSRGSCVGSGPYKCCVKSSTVLGGVNGYGLPFDVYKNKNLRTYFKAANSGLSSMEHRPGIGGWSDTNPIRYIISDNQECYYQKATYKDFYQTQYYQPSYKIFDEVCEERGDKSFSTDDIHACYRAADSGIYSKNYKLKEIIDYSKSDTQANYRQGYCLEFDYTKELYYTGSGKYNCINWMPGFVGR